MCQTQIENSLSSAFLRKPEGEVPKILLLMTSFVSLSKSMLVKTMVGTPRCPESARESAQRADRTIQPRQAICVILAPKITPNGLGNLNNQKESSEATSDRVENPEG
jgi:hypothetical protein